MLHTPGAWSWPRLTWPWPERTAENRLAFDFGYPTGFRQKTTLLSTTLPSSGQAGAKAAAGDAALLEREAPAFQLNTTRSITMSIVTILLCAGEIAFVQPAISQHVVTSLPPGKLGTHHTRLLFFHYKSSLSLFSFHSPHIYTSGGIWLTSTTFPLS